MFSPQIHIDMIEEGLIRLGYCDDHLPQLAAFAKRYRDRKPDPADLCLIRMSELHPKHSLFTVDKDFRVYRRNKREVIPVISPTTGNQPAVSLALFAKYAPKAIGATLTGLCYLAFFAADTVVGSVGGF